MKTFFATAFLFVACSSLLAQRGIPYASQLVPPSAEPGQGAFTLQVEGSGFAADAVVYWNGSARTTTVVSSDLLEASITAADVAKIGTVLVTVGNPGSGGGISNWVNFPVRRPWPLVAMALEPSLSLGQFSVAGDFNGDGKMDIATTGGSAGGIVIRLGKGDGTFEPPTTIRTGYEFNALVVGDFNGDGKLDLAGSFLSLCGGCGGEPTFQLQVLLGNGDGTFNVVKTKEVFAGLPLVAADFNGDGKLDLIVTNTDYDGSDWYPQVMLGKGDGTFIKGASLADTYILTYPAVGDFNGDGKLDVALPALNEVEGLPITYVYLGNGDGTFAAPAQYSSAQQYVFKAAVADVNGDGKMDIINDSVQVLLNNGDGTFTNDSNINFEGSQNVGGVVVGDFNGGGRIDFITGTNASLTPGSDELFLGNGSGLFQAFALEGATLLQAADFTSQGKLGLLTTGGVYVQTPASLSTQYANFGWLDANQQTSQTVYLSNVGLTSMTITGVSLSGSPAFTQTNTCPASLQAGKACQIQIVFAPTASAESYSSTLSVSIVGAPASTVGMIGFTY